MPGTKDRSLVHGAAVKPFFEAMRSQFTREGYERRLLLFLTSLNMESRQ